jgi:hypothetical protein
MPPTGFKSYFNVNATRLLPFVGLGQSHGKEIKEVKDFKEVPIEPLNL